MDHVFASTGRPELRPLGLMPDRFFSPVLLPVARIERSEIRDRLSARKRRPGFRYALKPGLQGRV